VGKIIFIAPSYLKIGVMQQIRKILTQQTIRNRVCRDNYSRMPADTTDIDDMLSFRVLLGMCRRAYKEKYKKEREAHQYNPIFVTFLHGIFSFIFVQVNLRV
jgi:hypothetical protein